MYKFILIDDEYAITEYFRQLINWNEIGYECAGNFATGKDAIEFIKHNHIDLVVTDIVMPDMDGLEVSRWIYENCPSVTVVFLSAHDDISYAKEAMKYNVRFYLNKPLMTNQLKKEFADIKKYLDMDKMSTDFFSASAYAGYFNGIAMNPKAYMMSDYACYDFSDCYFCIFEINIIKYDMSAKLLRSLYNIFIMSNENIKFCVLSHENNICSAVIFSHDEISKSWDREYIDTVKDSIGIDIEINSLRYFRDVSEFKDYYKCKPDYNPVDDAEESRKIENTIILNAKEYISENLSKPLSLEIVAKKCFVSNSWMSRLFKKYTGENISYYIARIRIEKSMELLCNNKMTVQEVADTVGMKNLPYFYTLFKKYTGMTPIQYRNQINQ